MRKDIDITQNDDPKKFQGPAKKGEVRNPAGRPKDSEEKKVARRTARFQTASTKMGNKMKLGMLAVFDASSARAIMSCYLEMKLPPQARRAGYKPGTKITPQEELMILSQIDRNFKWVMDWYAKIMPKEIGHFGKVQGELTLVGMVRRASLEDKSGNVIDLVQRRREREIYETEEQ